MKSVAWASLGYYENPGGAGGTSVEPPPPGFGGADIPDAKTLARVIIFELGAQVTYTWGTNIHKSQSGLEQRECTLNSPKQSYQGNAFMFTGDARDVRSSLAKNAASGAPFLLALPYEEQTSSADAFVTVVVGGHHAGNNTTIPLWDTTVLDWAQSGFDIPVVVITPSGFSYYSTIISVTPGTPGSILVAGNFAAQTVDGSRVMPVVPVLLEPQQGFVRWPVTAEQWQIKARAAGFGYGGVITMGVGAEIETYAGHPIFTKGIVVDGTVNDSIQTLGDIIDFGAVPIGVGAANTPDWGRRIAYKSSDVADWQWFKAILYTIRGANRAFWLSTFRPDLDVVSVTGAFITVHGSSVDGAGDPTVWWPDLRSRVEITMDDGSIQRVHLTAMVDNLDGTLTFQADAAIAGTIEMVSWLDLCRLEKDDVTVSWTQVGFEVAFDARAVIR